MMIVYNSLLWLLFATVPTFADSCISKSAVCCMVGQIEGKIFFDEIEGPGCSNRGNIQVIFNLVGFPSQGYNDGPPPHFSFRLKTYGEILPACSGVGPDYGYKAGHIADMQPFNDGTVYNDINFLPRATSGLTTDGLIGRAVAMYQGTHRTTSKNDLPLACCVIGRGQPVSLPLPSPTSPTPLGPTGPIDLTVAKQSTDPLTNKPDILSQNNGIEVQPTNNKFNNVNLNKDDIIITKNNNDNNNNFNKDRINNDKFNDNSNNFNNFINNNNNFDNNVQNNGPKRTDSNNNNNYNNNNNNNNGDEPNNSYPNNDGFNNNDSPSAPSQGIGIPENNNNPKYTLDEEELDNKFNLIGGYGSGPNFDFQSHQPRNNGNGFPGNTNGFPSNVNNNNNNNGYYDNIYSKGNNNYNTNTAGVFGPPNYNGREYPPNDSNGNNNNFNSFDNNDGSRNGGFSNSRFPSVFGSIGTGNFFNLDGKLSGAAIVNGNPTGSNSLGQGSEGVLGSSLGNGFEPPKGPSFKDIYNKPTGESPLSSSGFSDTVSPDEGNSISRLFFSDPQIKQSIGLTNEDKFIPRETEDEEESTSYRSDRNSDDNPDVIADDAFDVGVNDPPRDEELPNRGQDDTDSIKLPPLEDDPISSDSNESKKFDSVQSESEVLEKPV